MMYAHQNKKQIRALRERGGLPKPPAQPPYHIISQNYRLYVGFSCAAAAGGLNRSSAAGANLPLGPGICATG